MGIDARRARRDGRLTNPLADQEARDRFVRGHDLNISVIAPAGVGKTTAIVDRIVHLAGLPEKLAIERLTRLVVVTYSVRAAQEMQQRARLAIRKATVSREVRRAFQQVFFGTIHSFCVRLLDRFGHYLGLPSPVALLQGDEEIWQRFLLRGLDPALADDPHLSELSQFYAPEQLFGLGRMISPGEEIAMAALPELDLAPLLGFSSAGLKGPTRASIVRAQEKAQVWYECWRRGERFRQLPPYPTSPLAAEYAEVYRRAFEPLHAWLHDTALAFGRRIANAYERFRLGEATMTYDDQVRLALRVLTIPAAQREMAEEKRSVLLDEAQDTDPLQFEVLRRVAGFYAGESGMTQPTEQSLAVVGDFQQAIYAPRSDLATYRTIHEQIRSHGRGASARLEVTFRCDAAIIDFVNRLFPGILDHAAGQCSFETLRARDEAGPGQVVRLECPDLPAEETDESNAVRSARLHQFEAEFVARHIHELGYAGLGARSWSQVAILCPRKNWLLDLRRALTALGLRVQLHSSDETARDRLPVAWLTALIWVAAHPEDTFEIAGVLREIFGVADSDMAIFTGGDGDKLRLDRTAAAGEEGAVARALDCLREARAGSDQRPLGETVAHLMDVTQLRERLRLIPADDETEVDRELEDFLAQMAERAAEGVTLSELAHDLRAGFSQPSTPDEQIVEDAIQMMTSHKAKGLEWDAVVVPYLYRRIEWKQPEYPRVVLLGADDVMICRDQAEYEVRAGEAVRRRERQQCQRLYYVMFTRARRTLLLVDDEPLMSRQKKRSGEVAGEFLGLVAGPNRELFHALSSHFARRRASVAPLPTTEAAVPEFPVLSAQDLRSAKGRAGQFPRRVTPHTLAMPAPLATKDAEPEEWGDRAEDEAAVDPNRPGILYGLWWHEFMETISWELPATAWDANFAEAQRHSPQPERGAREWELFRRSALARWLEEPGRLVHAELPFLWPQEDGSCLEGVMDLAGYAEGEGCWHVIDWKTNRLGGEGAQPLVEIYRGQIEAYVRALGQMLGVEVRGSLYITATGEWLPVQATR